MHARVNTFQGPPDRVDDAIKSVREQILPAARQMPGFKGLLALADRSTGKAIGITLWETEQAMRDSEEAAKGLREQTADAGGEDILSVERYEVVVDSMA